MAPASPTLGKALWRGLRCRCPRCGQGRVFARRFRPERACRLCAWRFERGSGYFLGGNEINLVVTFPVGIAAYLVAYSLLGDSLLPPLLAAAATGAFGVFFSRPSRSLFYALDCWADPEHEDGADDGGSAGLGFPRPFPEGSVRLDGPPRLPADGLTWRESWNAPQHRSESPRSASSGPSI